MGPDWEKEPGRWRERREEYVVIDSGTGNREGRVSGYGVKKLEMEEYLRMDGLE